MSKVGQKITVLGVIVNALTILISFTCVFPLLWFGYSSLKTKEQFLGRPFALPEFPLQWGNYYDALIRSKILSYFFNTIFNAVGSVVVVLFFAFCIAFCMSRYDFRGKNLVNIILTAGMVIPAYSLLVPMYMQYQMIGIVNTRGVVILPYLAVNLPLSVFLIEAYLNSIPYELDQAAQIEGSSVPQIVTKVLLPLTKPILITVAILTFNYVWNEMPFALILTASDRLRNIGVGIMNFASSYDTAWPERIAACVIALIPVTLLYIIFNQQIIKGMTEGAVKG